MTTPKIGWGSPHVIPEDGVSATWGARAIITGNFLDIVSDRQGADGPEVDELVRRLNGGIIRELRGLVPELLNSYVMRSNEAEDFILYHDDAVIVHGNTNGSYGYLYLTAWLYEDRPVFKHDCYPEACRFLGHYEGRDLYACVEGENLTTVVARRSDDGPDYVSGLSFVDRNPHLAEALRRAEARGIKVTV